MEDSLQCKEFERQDYFKKTAFFTVTTAKTSNLRRIFYVTAFFKSEGLLKNMVIKHAIFI
jgi:hypothetical protein